MSSLADTQAYLRQKRATGRLSPDEMEAAYTGFYQNESNQSLARAQQDLSASHIATMDNQSQQRIEQENVRLATAERLAEEKRDAAKMAGKLQFAKMAVPDLFNGNEGKSESDSDIGAQGQTSQALGGGGSSSGKSSKTSSSKDGVPSYSDAYSAAEDDYGPDTSLKAVTGKSGWEHLGGWFGFDSSRAMGGNVVNVLANGAKGFGSTVALRAGTDIATTGWGYLKGLFTGAFDLTDVEKSVAQIAAEMDSQSGIYSGDYWNDSFAGGDGSGAAVESDSFSDAYNESGMSDPTDTTGDDPSYGGGSYDESNQSEWA